MTDMNTPRISQMVDHILAILNTDKLGKIIKMYDGIKNIIQEISHFVFLVCSM